MGRIGILLHGDESAFGVERNGSETSLDSPRRQDLQRIPGSDDFASQSGYDGLQLNESTIVLNDGSGRKGPCFAVKLEGFGTRLQLQGMPVFA